MTYRWPSDFSVRAAFRFRIVSLIAVFACRLSAGPTQIMDVSLQSSPGSTMVIVYLDSAVQYRFERLSTPKRLYVDLHDTPLNPHVIEQLASLHDVLFSRVRIGQNES